MFQHNHFFDFKDDKKKPNLFAIHFGRLKAYNPEWDIKKIFLYEYMLVCARKYGSKGKPFTQKYSMIMEATRMGRNSVSKYLKELEEDGFLNVKREEDKGVKQINWYKIDYPCIIKSFEQIYDFGDLPQDEIDDYKDNELKKWYDYHSEKSYRDANVGGGEDISITS